MLKVEIGAAGYDAQMLALRDVALEVGAGEIAAVIGPNGCGKSTLLRCVAGLLTPRSGIIALEGKDIKELAPQMRAQRIATLPQHADIGGDLCVEELVALGRTPHLKPFGTLGTRDLEIVDEAMQRTSTLDLRQRRVAQLSGGERQRVLLARALAQCPRVLLLDEPTSNLDLKFQYELLGMVHQLARQQQLAVVVVLHQINLAASLADRILLLNNDGSVRACGVPHEVMTCEYLGSVFGVPLSISQNEKNGRPQAIADWTFGEGEFTMWLAAQHGKKIQEGGHCTQF